MEIRQPDIIIVRLNDQLLMWLNSFNGQIEGEYRYTNGRWDKKSNSKLRIKNNILEFNHVFENGDLWQVWDSSDPLTHRDAVREKIDQFISSLDSILLGTSE